ncbi:MULTISPECIES: cytochrome b562 [unclassified Pasteurella]|uniref:cytochrome b562 n=1 Tax=unclassified Pasteurella TaxID=2621516 RepID=UPI00107431D6|nr:cytochrome B562 [Pasteurella sp. 19428wF3_WM03]TFU51985.1 cytochrome B562 [Pasteurella sp. WM03]
MKKLFTSFIFSFFTISILASDHISLRDEMMVMAQRLNFANRAYSVDEFQNNMDKFIEAAEKSKTIVPSKWKGDISQFPGYQQGLQNVIDVAKEAVVLSNQNRLSEAKEKLSEMPELRKMYHTLYK